mmetsp:Transcript_6421/g.17204  ORF Transcript_6421/g.17204 Transcript_6421/m.17204 type:complete len:112 (+) Transcript_6421:333-668(+)
MRYSTLSSWSPKALLWYAGQMLRGLYRPRILVEDTSQLGGDVLVSYNGYVLLSHPSRSPIDRVQVDRILSCLEREGAGASECPLCHTELRHEDDELPNPEPGAPVECTSTS